MESSFFVEAKSFLFSVTKRSETLRVVEKRKAFSGTVSLGSRCVAWLISTVEEALRSKIPDDFEKSFKEGSKATVVRGRGNKAGRFLEVSVNDKGGRRGMILFPEGREGRGWSRISGELSKTLAFFESMAKFPASDVLPGGIAVGKSLGSTSFEEVVCSPITIQGSREACCDLEKMVPMGRVQGEVCEMDLLQMETRRDVDDGRMAVNCFELERQPPRPTKVHGPSTGGDRVRTAKKLGFSRFWRILVKRVWASLKPNGFRMKSKLKMALSNRGPYVCGPDPGLDRAYGSDKNHGSDQENGSNQERGSDHSHGSDLNSESDFPDSEHDSSFVPGFGPVSVLGPDPRPTGCVSGSVSLPRPGSLLPPVTDGSHVKPPLGATSLGSVEKDPGMAVRHSFPAKVPGETNFDTISGLSVQDKADMDTSNASALLPESPIHAGVQCDSSEAFTDDSSDSISSVIRSSAEGVWATVDEESLDQGLRGVSAVGSVLPKLVGSGVMSEQNSPPWAASLYGSDSCSLDSNSSIGLCSSDTLSVDYGLTKSQNWQIEWAKEKLKVYDGKELTDEDRLGVLKNMAEDFRWENRVAREEGLLVGDEEEDRKVAWLNEVKENMSITIVLPEIEGRSITL